MPVQHILKYFILNFIEILNVTALQNFSCAVAKNKIIKPLFYSFHSKPPVSHHWGLKLPANETQLLLLTGKHNLKQVHIPSPREQANPYAKWRTVLPRISPEACFCHQKHVPKPSSQATSLLLLRPPSLARCDILILPQGNPWCEPSLAPLSEGQMGQDLLLCHSTPWQDPWHWGLSLQAILFPVPEHSLHQSLT